MNDIDTFRNMLRINKHRLDDELEIQPDILDRISQRVVILNSRAIEAQDELKRCEAEAYFACRDRDEKASEKNIAEQVRIAPARLKSWQRSQAARSELEDWQGLYEAWKQRGYSLKELVALYAAQYFSVDGHHNVDRSDRPRPPARLAPAPAAEEAPRTRRRIE